MCPRKLAEVSLDREVAEARDKDAVAAVGDARAGEGGREKRRPQHGEGSIAQHLPGEERVEAACEVAGGRDHIARRSDAG